MKTHDDLRRTGLKVTEPRVHILRLFETQILRHASADEVYQALITQNIDIGIATVYRVLTQFEQAGILVRHHFETERAVFELNSNDHHDHLVCLQCGLVEEFVDDEIEKRQIDIAAQRGFKIRAHALYLYGDCQQQNCPHRPMTTE